MRSKLDPDEAFIPSLVEESRDIAEGRGARSTRTARQP
jgi:hypothetical protein